MTSAVCSPSGPTAWANKAASASSPEDLSSESSFCILMYSCVVQVELSPIREGKGMCITYAHREWSHESRATERPTAFLSSDKPDRGPHRLLSRQHSQILHLIGTVHNFQTSQKIQRLFQESFCGRRKFLFPLSPCLHGSHSARICRSR